MGDIEKIYQLTIENNANIKFLMKENMEMKAKINHNYDRIINVENLGKETLKEHLISFSKVCGALLIIGSGFTMLVKLAEKIWP